MKVAEESLIGGSSSRPIHVYLSFKGDEETCRFTDMLWAALESNDLNTFWDDKNLEDPGHSILLPRHFLKPIRQSNISIIVFSKKYASSIWCLEELSEIAARIHDRRFTVFPIFYDVNPSEVQNQGHSFETAFAEHELRFTVNLRKVRSWRLAMKQVANLSGWDITHELWPEVIDDVVRKVKRKVRELAYADADLVGMQSRVREVEELLDLGSNDDMRVMGICGMGGIGKSTLVRVLYDKISHHFDASYLVLNSIEFYETTGLRHYNKRTLIVFDCDDNFNIIGLLLVYAIRVNQLGGGSRIVITTRDEGMLKMFEKHHIYRVKLLTREEALQLFCRKAFKCDFPMRGYEGPIESVLQYASGLPLAIVILSQLLYNRRASEWSSVLVESKKVVDSMIMKVLKRSFDDLELDCKGMFLDLACFFIGKEITFVLGILSSTHVNVFSSYIQVLIEKSLMTVTDKKLQMHGLLQEMGREIVRREFPSSRLWDFDGINEVMQDDIASSKVEGIVLELEDSHEGMLRVEGLSRMTELRLLIFRNVKCSGVLESLSRNLRYISWHKYPFTSLPSHFEPKRLMELILPDSRITCIWEEGKLHESPSLPIMDMPYSRKPKEFVFLKSMSLNGSKDLINLPNFEEFPSLKRLDLEGCIKLSHLHPSIARGSHLKFLNLRHCTSLVSIPNDLFSLPSLEMLNLAGCSKFVNCPNFSMNPFSSSHFPEEDRSDLDNNLCKCTICPHHKYMGRR